MGTGDCCPGGFFNGGPYAGTLAMTFVAIIVDP
jgi:hypothetical protein